MTPVARPILLATALLLAGAAPAWSDELPLEPAIVIEGVRGGIAVSSERPLARVRTGCRRCPGAGLPWGGLREPRIAEVPWAGLREPRIAEVPWGGLGGCPPAPRLSRSGLVRAKG